MDGGHEHLPSGPETSMRHRLEVIGLTTELLEAPVAAVLIALGR
jgi:hypothetical protein